MKLPAYLSLSAAAIVVALSTPAVAIELEMQTYQLEEGGFGVFWRAAAEEFAKRNPGHTVKMVNGSFEEHHNRLTTRFVAGNPADLTHISARFFFGYADQGFLEPLDDRLKAIGWKEDDFIRTQRDMRRNGKVYGQLMLGYGWGLFYNADMLTKAGIAVPTTEAEFLEAARKLTIDRDKDGRVDQYGFVIATDKSSQTHMNLSYLLAGAKLGWTKDGTLIDKKDLRNVLATTADLVKSNASPAGLGSTPMRQLFWQGNAAMYIDGSWAIGYKKDATPEI